jgi:hypothetical protein
MLTGGDEESEATTELSSEEGTIIQIEDNKELANNTKIIK